MLSSRAAKTARDLAQADERPRYIQRGPLAHGRSLGVFAPRDDTRSCDAICELRRNHPGLFQRGVGAVLIQRLHPARGHANTNELFQFRHPDAALVQVRAEGARNVLGHVTPDAALFLGHTTAVNDAPARDH
jgi:hypothetical protein